MSSAMFADPEMVQLWDEAVKAHREKTAVDLKNEQNKNKTQIFIKFWISLKPATSTSSSPSTPEKEPESPVNPSKAQERELVDELTREHEMFQKLRNDGGKVAKTREYLGRYASTMASIGPVLESVVEDAFPPAAMVAVAFTHIVTSFVAVSDDLNLIENLFDIMTSFAERLSLLRKIPKERRFRNLILKTFTCMLEFCTSAHYRLQKDNYRIRAWAKALFKGQDEKLKESYDRVITAIDDMGKATVTQILAVALEIQDDTERTLQRGFSRMDSGFMKMNNGLNLVLTNQRHETQRNQRRDKETRGFRAEIRKNNDKIINILLEKSTSKSGSEARKVSSLEIITKSLFTGAEYFLAQRWAKMEREFVKDTFTWFDKDYEKLKEMDGGVMFISGASGMGKSFFSFAVMSRLAKDFEDVPSTSVASFMFDQDNEKLETIRSMLYFCSAQVASTDDSYRQHVQKVVDNLDDTKGDWKADPWKHLFADKFQKDDKLPAKLFLILDGIDQLEEEPELRRLVEIINDQKSQGLRINFVISGTPEMVGEERIPEALIKKKIHLIPETMAPDFKLFAKSQLESVQGLAGHRPALKERIAEALEENADTFFYVTYFLRQLEIMRISSLVENSIVHALPESTEAIYQRLFQECEQYFPDSNQKKALGYLFTWLAYSYHKITLIAAQNLIDLIMVSILGEKESTLNIRIETMGRLSRLLAFSEPFDEAPPMSPGDSDNANEQNGLGANGRNRRKNEKAEPEVLLTWQQHSLRDYFNKHPEKSSSFLRPTKHETSVMMFKMAVAILAAPKRKSKRQMSEGERNLETIAAHCVFGHLSDAQPLQSEDEIASVAQSLYTLLGQGDGALEKIEANFEFAEDSPDATDYCSIFVPPREIEESSRETVLPTVDRILQSLLDLGSRVAKLPTEAKVQISADASYWIRTTLESRYSILTSIAMGHIRNWFSDRAVSPSKAFAAFRFAHVALWTLTKEERNKLVETTGVKFTDEDFPEDLRDDFPDRTFELVASLGGNPLGPRDHKQISKALQFDLRNKGSKEQAEKGLKEAKDPREIFDLRYRIARAHFDECVYPEPISSPDSNTQPVTPESVLQAWETCLKEIPTTDPDGSLQIMLNVAYQIKARVESMIEGAQSKALVSMQEAAKRKTPESFPRFFEELVVAFGERGLWNEIVQLLGYYDNPLTVKCRDMTHRFIQRAAMATGKQGIVRDYYIKAANAPDEFNGADESEVRIWLASFEWFVMQDQDRAKNAKEQLKHVLKSKQSGFLWSEKAGRKLADILLEEFRMSRQLSYKTDRLAEMEEVILSLRDRLGLEFKPKLSQTSTTLASMRRKLGPAHTFYQSLNDTFEAACEALNDMTETNDTPSLRLLAKVLSLVPGRTQDAQIALSCQFYLLPSRKSSSSSDPNAPGIKIVGTGSSGLVQTTQPPRRTPSPTKRSSPNRTPSPSKRGGSASPNSRTPSPASVGGLGTPTIPPTTRQAKKNRSPSRPAAAGSRSPRPGTPQVAEPTEAEKSEYDFNKHTQIECAACNKTISSFTKGRIYMCVYCTNVDLCEECYYKRLRYYGKSQEGVIGLGFGLPVESEVDRKSYVEVCPWGHELIEAPVKGWKGVRGEMLEFGDEVVGFQDWLDGLRKKWEQSWRVYWREVDDE